MSKAGHNIRIGTSGWHYEHWGGRFYPEGLPKQQARSVFAYFNNDIDANAVRNAKTLKEQLVRE